MSRLLACVIPLAVAQSHADPGEVHLRGGRVIDAEVVTTSPQSVVAVVDGQPFEFGWHRVIEIKGAAAPDAHEYLALAENAWRGLARLERGDHVAAEPLLEQVYMQLDTDAGATSAAVSLGLLECRVMRGAQALSVMPFLSAQLNRDYNPDADIMDTETGLCPSLPPIWQSDSGLAAMSQSVSRDAFSDWDSDPRSRQLAELYVSAAVHQISGKAPVPSFVPADDGVRFVKEIVTAKIGDEQQRTDARELLTIRNQQNIADWQRAWIHAAVGYSLLAESDSRSKRLGILQLLHVPALYSRSQPYLAGVCLSESALAFERIGRGAEAVRLASEFQRIYRTHNAGELPEMRLLIRKANQLRAADNPNEDDA